MTTLLHASAIAPAALGACCLAAGRDRTRWPDGIASALMLIAMLDSAFTRLLASVYWVALLLASAMALAAWQRGQRTAHGRAASACRSAMTAHMGLGLIAMAALQVGMTHGPVTSTAVIVTAHGHVAPVGESVFAVMLVAGALAYGAMSAFLGTRAHRKLDRVQVVCMGASVLLMAVGAVV